MIANSIADWFTSILNIVCILIFIGLMIWHGYVLKKLYGARTELERMLSKDVHNSATKFYNNASSDSLNQNDWTPYYTALMRNYEPYLHNHYDILPFYTLTGLLGTVLSIIFSYNLENQAQLGIALLSTGIGIVLSMVFRTLGTFPARNRERYLSHYRQIEYPQNSSNQEDKQS